MRGAQKKAPHPEPQQQPIAALTILRALLEKSVDDYDESDRGGAKERIVFDKGLMRLVGVSNADQDVRQKHSKSSKNY